MDMCTARNLKLKWFSLADCLQLIADVRPHTQREPVQALASVMRTFVVRSFALRVDGVERLAAALRACQRSISCNENKRRLEKIVLGDYCDLISRLVFAASVALYILIPRPRLSWINLSARTKIPCFGRLWKY